MERIMLKHKKKTKIGIVFGCFAPLHTGHMKLIDMATDDNDKVIICTCGYDNDRAKDFIPFQDRIKLVSLQYYYEFIKGIYILSYVDDHAIGLTGKFDKESWEKWANELFKRCSEQVDPNSSNIEFTWYTGEDSYIEKLSEIYPEHKFVKVDRDELPISGTMIRKDPDKYKDNISEVFYRYITTKKENTKNEVE